MNIQIFGTKKCFDTKKAERYFKERKIKFQSVDLKEKGMSKGELESVIKSAGGIDNVINKNAKDTETLTLFNYLREEDKFSKLLENQQLLITPVVRNGKKSTTGYQPDVWKEWENE